MLPLQVSASKQTNYKLFYSRFAAVFELFTRFHVSDSEREGLRKSFTCWCGGFQHRSRDLPPHSGSTLTLVLARGLAVGAARCAQHAAACVRAAAESVGQAIVISFLRVLVYHLQVNISSIT